MFAIDQLIQERLELKILRAVKRSKEPVSCAGISDSLDYPPDRETLSREVFDLKQKGHLSIAYMAKDENRKLPRDVAHYIITESGEAYLALHDANIETAAAEPLTVEETAKPAEQVFDIPAFLRKDEAAPVDKFKSTKVYKMLCHIEANPGCGNADLTAVTGSPASDIGKLLETHIARGSVGVVKDGRKNTYYTNMPVGEMQFRHSGKRSKSGDSHAQNPTSAVSQTPATPPLSQPANTLLGWDDTNHSSAIEKSVSQVHQDDSNENVLEVVEQVKPFAKAFNEANIVDQRLRDDQKNAAVDLHSPLSKESGSEKYKPTPEKFRVAYTSDKCLILYGLNDYGMPVELDAEKTAIVMKFLGDQALSENVSAALEERTLEILRK